MKLQFGQNPPPPLSHLMGEAKQTIGQIGTALGQDIRHGERDFEASARVGSLAWSLDEVSRAMRAQNRVLEQVVARLDARA